LTYCLDDEGTIPLIDVRHLHTSLAGGTLQIQHGLSMGPRGYSFGFRFPEDMAPPGDEYKERPAFPFPSREHN
jgi:hypothetical protein